MRNIQIRPELLSLLISGQINQFTIVELRDAYIALPECKHKSKSAAQQFIYKNILRLESRGLVERIDPIKGKSLRFMLTPEFLASEHETSNDMAPDQLTIINQNSVIQCLREKLSRHKLELLSAIGETEAYDEICNELPQIREHIQNLYNQARDKCSKTLGKVRALESLISLQQDH